MTLKEALLHILFYSIGFGLGFIIVIIILDESHYLTALWQGKKRR